jgi:hypothetical protein
MSIDFKSACNTGLEAEDGTGLAQSVGQFASSSSLIAWAQVRECW